MGDEFLIFVVVLNQHYYPSFGLSDVAYSGNDRARAEEIAASRSGGSVAGYLFGFRPDGTYEELEVFGDPLKYIV